MKRVALFTLICLLSGCASGVRVLESTGNRSNPDWTVKQTYETGGKTYFVGSAVTEYGSLASCFITSDSKSLSEAGHNLANHFRDQETSIEGVDTFASKRVISSLRTERPLIEGLTIVDRYSELVRIEYEGQFRLERRCWTLSVAPTGSVNAAIQRLARKLGSVESKSTDQEIEKAQSYQLEQVERSRESK